MLARCFNILKKYFVSYSSVKYCLTANDPLGQQHKQNKKFPNSLLLINVYAFEKQGVLLLADR